MSDTRWRESAACNDHDLAIWFPTRLDPDNHGTQAIAICTSCPVRRECLTWSLAENQRHGIAGGAGEDIRRGLRRRYRADGPSEGPIWRSAALRHFQRLDGAKPPLEDRNGPQATHGNPTSYARGCRCVPCTLSAALRGAAAKLDRPRRRTAA